MTSAHAAEPAPPPERRPSAEHVNLVRQLVRALGTRFDAGCDCERCESYRKGVAWLARWDGA